MARANVVVIPQVGQGQPVRLKKVQEPRPMARCVPRPEGFGGRNAAMVSIVADGSSRASPMRRSPKARGKRLWMLESKVVTRFLPLHVDRGLFVVVPPVGGVVGAVQQDAAIVGIVVGFVAARG